jgi:hypothetical protein
MHSIGVAGVENAGKNWLKGHESPVAKQVWTPDAKRKRVMKPVNSFVNGTYNFTITTTAAQTKLNIPMVAPENCKGSIRLHAERQPNVTRISEIIGVPFVGHENEVASLARHSKHIGALGIKRRIGICSDAGVAECSPWAQDIIGG